MAFRSEFNFPDLLLDLEINPVLAKCEKSHGKKELEPFECRFTMQIGRKLRFPDENGNFLPIINIFSFIDTCKKNFAHFPS